MPMFDIIRTAPVSAPSVRFTSAIRPPERRTRSRKLAQMGGAFRTALSRMTALSPVKAAAVLVAFLAIAYIGLIAVVMSYAASTIDFAQNVRNDEAHVSQLEASYLNQIASITDTNYTALGYVKPAVIAYVPSAQATALR